jgi:hypothetical protein
MAEMVQHITTLLITIQCHAFSHIGSHLGPVRSDSPLSVQRFARDSKLPATHRVRAGPTIWGQTGDCLEQGGHSGDPALDVFFV